MTDLYMMTQVDIHSGETKIVYGHATANVIAQYWAEYTDDDHCVEIQRLHHHSMMETPRPVRETPR